MGRRAATLAEWPPLRTGRIATPDEYRVGLLLVDALQVLAARQPDPWAALGDALFEILVEYEQCPVPGPGERVH